ncbi:MAG: cupredoxin domain-containing protein [Thermomicrobiales bacterium]
MESHLPTRQNLSVKRAARPLAAVAFTVAGLGLLGSALATTAQTETPTATATPPAICGTPTAGDTSCVGFGMYDIYFKPNTGTFPSDSGVEVALQNFGVTDHNFSITDHGNSGLKNLDISVTLKAGESGDVTVNAPEGQYYFFCNQPGHEQAGMYGYLTVKKDATVSTAEVTVTPRAD